MSSLAEKVTPVLLNIGCGHKHFPKEDGWVNIDFPDNSAQLAPDVAADIRCLPLESNYADEAHAIHSIEHIQRYEVEDTLKEWFRVLKPGGKLVLEMPCLDKVLQHFFKQGPVSLSKTLWGLYGNPNYKNEHMVHKWCYCMEEITHILETLGARDIKILEPVYHFASRDMRVEAIKP